MFVLGSVVILAASLQIISSQGPPGPPPNIPPQCRGPPPGVERPMDCCKVPKFLEPKDEDFKECGFKKLEDEPRQPRPPGPPPPPDCSKQLCLFEKYGLAKDGAIDYEAVSAFMDKYAEANEDFKPTVAAAKERCVGKELPGPPHVCESSKLLFCVSSTLFSECPLWEESDGCKTLKEHMEQCKPFFMRS